MDIQEILKYVQVIRKWWWIIVIVTGATIGTLAVIALSHETVYEATATLQVSAPPPQEVPLYSQFGRQALRDEIEQTRNSLSEFLQSGDTAFRVVQKYPELHLTGRELREKTTVELPKESELMFIRVQAADADTAALLTNEVVNLGLEGYGELRAQPTLKTASFIENELEVARQEMNDAENEFVQFQINNRIGNLDQMMTLQQDLLRTLRLQRDLALSDAKLDQVQVLEQIIQEREIELQNMVGLSADYNRLANQVKQARDRFDFLLAKRSEAQIKANQILELSSVQIITPARPPRNPASTIRPQIIVLGAVASTLVGILLTFLMEYLELIGVTATLFPWRKTQAPSIEVAALSDNPG